MARSSRLVQTQFETSQFSFDFLPKLLNGILVDCNIAILIWLPAKTLKRSWAVSKVQILFERVQKIKISFYQFCSFFSKKLF